jgi:hypothetical protein
MSLTNRICLPSGLNFGWRAPSVSVVRRWAAAAGDVDAVDLAGVVAVALGDEDQLLAVRRPVERAFAAFAEGQAAGRRVIAQRFDPQVRPLFLAVVGGIGDGEHGPFAVRAGLRCADALHQPYILVGDGVFGGADRPQKPGPSTGPK